MLKFKQARGRNALAKLRTPPSKTITTPTIIQSEHNTITPYDKSKSKSPSAEAQGKSSTESKAKRNDGGGDDEDKEITPRRRAKKRKLVSSGSEHSIAKSKSARSGPDSAHENEVSPIVRSVEHRGDALPTRSKLRSQNKPFRLKGPTKPDSAQVHGSLPPLQDDPEIHNLVDEGVEYVRALEAVQQQDLRLSPSNVTQDQTEKTPTPSAFTPNDQVSREATTGQTPVAEERQDHIPHQSAQRSESSQPQPGSKPKIRYYVISSLYRRLWPDVSLGEKSIEAMFNDVEPFAGKRNIEHIIFKLTTSQRSAEFKIPRHDPEIYEEMKVYFAAEISKDLARGKTNFKIELEPDPTLEVMAVETQEDDVGPKFSW